MEAVRDDIKRLLDELTYPQLGDVRGYCYDRMRELSKKMKAADLFKPASTQQQPTQYKESSE